MSARCILSLFTSPTLVGCVFGLQQSEGTLRIDPKLFPCCGGNGLCFREDVQAAVRCSLQKNLINVRNVYQDMIAATTGRVLFEHEWRQLGGHLPVNLQHVVAAFAERRLGAYLLTDTVSTQRGMPIFWAYCLTAAWRFGLRVSVLNLAKDSWESLTQKLAQAASAETIAVCGVHKLSDPGYADLFEAIVATAYHGMKPLLVDGAHGGSGSEKTATGADSQIAGFRTKGMFSQRARQLKQQHPFKFLQKDCHSRLSAMLGSEGAAIFEGLIL